MAKLPIYTSKQQVTNQEIGGKISPSVGGQIGNAAAQFGNEIAQWGLAQAKAQEEMSVIAAQTAAADEFAKLAIELKKTPPGDVPRLFETGSATIVERANGTLNSPFAKRNFQGKFGALKNQYSRTVQKDANARFIKNGVAGLDAVVASRLKIVGQTDKINNPEEYNLQIKIGQQAISGAYRAGFLDKVQAGNQLRKFLSDADEGQALIAIRKDPEGSELLILDKKNFPHLSTLAHERMAKLAISAAERSRKTKFAIEEKAEKKREKVLKRAQSLKANTIINNIIKSEDIDGDIDVPDNSELLTMQSNREINGTQVKEIFKLKETLNDAVTDDESFIEILEDIDEIARLPRNAQAENIELIEIRMKNLMLDGKLEKDDAIKVMNAISKINDKNYKHSPEVRASGWLKRSLGGAEAEISIPGYREDPLEKLRRNNAMREFRDRMDEDNAKPWEIAEDIFRRSVNVQNLQLSAYPRPKFGVNKAQKDWTSADVQETILNTIAAWNSRKITDKNAFAQEIRNLNQLNATIRLIERHKANAEEADAESKTEDKRTKERIKKAIE